MKKFFRGTYLAMILAFLYAPIVVLMVLSFNASKSRAQWDGFTLQWYLELFSRKDMLSALYVTLSVAFLSALIATILGTTAALGIHFMKKRSKNFVLGVSSIPMLTPDIVIGLSLMILFLALRFSLGYTTMLLAHVAFNVPYVIFSVLPKLKQMNAHLYEAALDLGARPAIALWRVILPEIMPGVVTGAILSFTLSLDDFVVSFFTSTTVQNLSVMVYSMARKGIHPTINALSTLMFAAILALLLIVNKRAGLDNVM